MSGQYAKYVISALIAFMLTPASARAQPQTAVQRGCLIAVNKAAQRVVKAEGRAVTECFAAVVRGEQHPDRCPTFDPGGDVAAALAKLAEAFSEKCGEVPDFGLSAASTANSASIAETVDLHRNLYPVAFGFDGPNSFLDWASYVESPRCAERVEMAIAKLYEAKLKVFGKCARNGLMAGTITSEAGLADCLASTHSSASTLVAKRAAKVQNIIDEQCDHHYSLPIDADILTDCATCGFALGVHAFSGECGDPNYCARATCGNAVVGGEPPYPVEQCDDGNFLNGDGCDNNCTVTGCGNRVVTGSEYCDVVAGRCIGGSYDGLSCQANAECTGGFCTYGPSGSCKSDCSACGPGVCCAFVPSACTTPGYWPGQVCASGTFSCDSPGCTSSGTCCVFGDVCTAFGSSLCDEYEGTLVDCSQCAP